MRPFYGVTQLAAQDIVYCISNVSTIENSNLNFIFTDGHAVDYLTTFYNSSNTNNITTIIEEDAIFTRYWTGTNDADLKRKKQAELLVLGDIPIAAILGYVVYNKVAETQLIQLGIPQKVIRIIPAYYF